MHAGRGVLVLTAALLAGCPTSSQTCPSGTSPVGTKTLTFSPKASSDACVVTAADGGTSIGGITATPASESVTLCAGLAGAGYQLYLGAGGGALAQAADGGPFTATTPINAISGSLCSCAIDVLEGVSVQVATADGGPFGKQEDGGFTPLVSVSGAIDYTFSRSASNNGLACTCGFPCGAHYLFSGL